MRDPHVPPSELDLHLSQVSTRSGLTVQEMCLRYRRPVETFLGHVLGDRDAAADLTQDIMVKLLSGKLAAWEGRGRFRDYMKAVVRNAAIDFRARAKKREREAARFHLHSGNLAKAGISAPSEADQALDELWDVNWARHIKRLAWHNLRRHQLQQTRKRGEARNAFYTLLRLRVQHPCESIARITDRLVRKTGRPYTETTVRQQLTRARAKLAELLKQEVMQGIPSDRAADLDQELLAHNLSRYVGSLARDDQRS